MINELDRVVLTEAVPGESLEKGDVGTVVHVYDAGKAYEIEFTTLESDKRLALWIRHQLGFHPLERRLRSPVVRIRD